MRIPNRRVVMVRMGEGSIEIEENITIRVAVKATKDETKKLSAFIYL